jgi:hypothetical protein
MSYTLVLNNTNVVSGTSNNTYQYKFILGSLKLKNYEMAISSFVLPYSWFNVTNLYNNRTISFTFPTGATTTPLNITLPEGFYTVADIQNYIYLQCINAGLYLIDSSGNYVIYVNIYSNPTYYANTIILSQVPTTLPTGYSYATSGTYSVAGGLPTVAGTPSCSFAASGSLAVLLGFNASQTLVAAVSSFSTNSPNTPIGSTVNGVIVRCSMINNPVIVPSDVLDAVSISGATFGANINYNPSFQKFVDVSDGNYNQMTITLVDQNLNSLIARDSNILLTLQFRPKQNN